MRAARFHGPGAELLFERVPEPRPSPGEALLRVRAAGVCHTELHLLDGVLNQGVVPLIPGHEVVADVIELNGPSPVAVGERVVVAYCAPCGDCVECRAGHEQLCPNMGRQIGFTADGGYAELLTAPIESLVPLPVGLADEDAVGLACGAAAALHALGVGEVRLGERVVVSGVGGVGFYLIQLCIRAGARVLGVGRSPAKLALARDFGAEVVEGDPVRAAYAFSDGRGADVVFDLVASAATLRAATRMLARRGRLVLAAYDQDELRVHPLRLVLREIQVRGAVSSTVAELRQVVDLAGRGELRSVVGGVFALEQVNQVLAALRRGEIVGRAVLVPTLAAPADATFQTEPTVAAREQAVSVPPDAARGTDEGRVTLPGYAGGRAAGGREAAECERSRSSGASAPGLGPTTDGASVVADAAGSLTALERELLGVIGRGVDQPLTDAGFNELALRLFAYQFERNEPYRQFCESQRRHPGTVTNWRELPAVPIAAFKSVELACEPVDQAAALFMSSGTTRPEERSRHFHPRLAVYDAATRTNFAAHVLPDQAQLPFLVLNPMPRALPNSSLAYYLDLMTCTYGTAESDFFVDDDGLRFDALGTALTDAVRGSTPVCVVGTTFAFVHLLDRYRTDGTRFDLPPGSRVFDTGGVKGRSRDITRSDLQQQVTQQLGVPPTHQLNMYGLTELSTQFIDATLREHLAGHPLAAHPWKTVPRWARTRVLDPETLAELPAGEIGVLCHTDLANWASVCTVLTEDLGVQRDGGFEILGRLQGTQARGCSLAVDELLAATGPRS
jgi:D-arabinose 1-dehydrogenase-like Zn-dependent alcohol dehydrogenase